MSQVDASGRHRVLDVMGSVIKHGAEGCSIEDIAHDLGIKYHPVRRALGALEAAGWVMAYRNKGSKQNIWMPGEQLVQLAFQYKRDRLRRIHEIESEYARVTGEMLRDEE